MESDTPDSRVFDWLGTDTDGVGYHLNPLNLVWSKDGPEHDLRVFASVADKLVDQPAYWSEIIRTSSWQHTLVGCVCVLLVRPSDRFQDLFYRFDFGSFVSPQICLTMGVVYPHRAIDSLNEFLDREYCKKRKCKEIAAAESVLAKLGVRRSNSTLAHDIELTHSDDAEIGKYVVESQWEFWCKYSGRLLKSA